MALGWQGRTAEINTCVVNLSLTKQAQGMDAFAGEDLKGTSIAVLSLGAGDILP